MTTASSSPERVPHGSWPSPLAAADVAAAAPRIEGARFVGEEVWWGETVPDEGGRTTVRRRRAGRIETVLPAPWNARSRVHEYGGGAWAATDEGDLLFVDKADQRVRRLRPGGEPQLLTPSVAQWRWGGLRVQRGRLLAVREVFGRTSAHDIVEIPLDGSAADAPDALRVLTTGPGFVAQPALSPDGTMIAWVSWDHPHMPWERAQVRVASLHDAPAVGRVLSSDTGAALQPEWETEGVILFSDDARGFWNLRRRDLGTDASATEVTAEEGDIGGPLWGLGSRWYGLLDDGRIVAARTHGRDDVIVVPPHGGTVERVSIPPVGGVRIEDARGAAVLVSGSPADAPAGLWAVDLAGDPRVELVRGGRWTDDALTAWVPRPRALQIAGRHGTVHAFDFPPTHPAISAPDDEAPPYVIVVHGGPTDHSPGIPSPKTLYLTSRGIGVVEVNYGGSSGYGRDYRERLRGQWGVVDVDDVIDTAEALVRDRVAHPRRIAVAGGSAGGWTVLGALTRSDVFAAGISRYGVADARSLATETHDFESHYLDGLIGSLPESESVYLERSPLTHAHRICAPVLLLQGEEDTVVPPAQSEAIRDALRRRGVPHAYVSYSGEGHGFRRSETIADMVQREVAFLGAAFGFRPADGEPLTLE